jgi:ribosomal protein L16 Arg81 hydroxylase
MEFSDLIAPLSVERFMADFYQRRPLHIPAPSPGNSKAVLGWQRMNELLAIRSHWSEANLKLIMNSRPIFPELYLDEFETADGRIRRAVAAKVDVFLSMGASLVANSVDEVSPEVRAINAGLADHFSARAGANVYCSFQGVQAFGSHCDLHEVFAIQCEGEKSWNIYENRAAAPVELLKGDGAQAMIDAAKGRVMMRARMRPGDLLYIPRGYYHDAVASNDASLHLTFSVAPLTGRAIFRLLEDKAVESKLFREYLPDGREESGKRLRQHLQRLSDILHDLLRAEDFAAEIGERQRALWEPNHDFTMPRRQKLAFYARTQKPAVIGKGAGDAILAAGNDRVELGRFGPIMEWLLSRPAFSEQELLARYRREDPVELRAFVSRLEQAGIFLPYTPQV